MQPHLPTLAVLVAATLLAGCGGTGGGDPAIFGDSEGGTLQPGLIKQAGSSTVLPLAEVWAEEFGRARGVQFQVAGGGSGKGASGLCAKEHDLADMSRQLKSSERGTCRANGVEPVEWKVAYDALSVVVSNRNTFVQDLSVEQLEHLFRAEDPARTWREVDPAFPNEPVRLCYPDSDSGTYEYFNEAILEGAAPRTGSGVQQSSDDNVLVTCLKDDAHAIGYFGLAYVGENQAHVHAVGVEGVMPTPETVRDGSYQPLSRFVYIYTDGVPRDNLLADYLAYVFMEEGGQRLVSDVGYVPLDADTVDEMNAQLGIA